MWSTSENSRTEALTERQASARLSERLSVLQKVCSTQQTHFSASPMFNEFLAIDLEAADGPGDWLRWDVIPAACVIGEKRSFDGDLIVLAAASQLSDLGDCCSNDVTWRELC